MKQLTAALGVIVANVWAAIQGRHRVSAPRQKPARCGTQPLVRWGADPWTPKDG